MIQLGFYGAAGTVTGSKYWLATDKTKVLIDCGMFQGKKALRQLNWQPPGFETTELDAVILTHAHIDHIGYLPKLSKLGYTGPVHATPPTIDLATISLLDSAEIQEEDAEWRNRKKLSSHEKALPLYTVEDAEAAITLFKPVLFDNWTSISDDIRFRMHVAGHVLGAASVEVEITDGNERKSILFSGDVGRYGNPLTSNPEPPPECDYLVCESTYGGRMHEPEDPRAVFTQLIKEVIESKSVLLIPAFAVSRTQQIIYLINELIRLKAVPPIEIHVDSPMAISATDVYCKYHSYHSVDLKEIGGDKCVLEGKYVTLHRKRKSSKTLNNLHGPAIIMSSSGMLTGGRIMHHLLNRLPDKKTIVCLVGFMAEGTLGRKLSEGVDKVYIHKQPVEIKAQVKTMHGLSGHADFQELLHWLEPVEKKPNRVFVTHGEQDQSEAMAKHLQEEFGWKTHIPKLGEVVQL